MRHLTRRLFESFWDVVRQSTKVESIVLPVLLFGAGLAFRSVKAQGLQFTDVTLIVVPAVWVACILCGYFFLKAAVRVRRDDILAWQKWHPVLKEAEILRPPRPGLWPIATLTVAICAVLASIGCGLTALVPPILPVKVFPQRVTFHRGAKDEQYTFAITNSSDQDWYSAVVDIRILARLPIDQFHFDADPKPLVVASGDIGAINDPITLGTTENRTQFPGWWFLYYQIKAHETREIKLKRYNIGEIKVSANVTGLAAEPQPLNVTDNSIMFRFSKDNSIAIRVRDADK